METDNELLNNLDQLHHAVTSSVTNDKFLFMRTAPSSVVCRTKISSDNAVITRKGKNWYAAVEDCIITVNAYSYTLITAHKQ